MRTDVTEVKDGRVLAKAHRGEFPKEHTEVIALERKLANVSVVGATVYATLEPCTTRTDPKVPCAERLAERKVARVFIGMLDPNPDIRGMSQMVLSEADIETQLFLQELMSQVAELNRDFIRKQAQKQKSTVDPKLEMISSSKGKIVTVTNRRSNTYWGSDTVVVDCNAVFVTLKNVGSSEPQSFPSTQVDVSFDHKNNRLSIDLDRY